MEVVKYETMREKLYRSGKDNIITGVCGGLGDYFGIDSILIRLGFVLLTVWGGSGVVLYIVMSILIPKEKGGSVTMDKENKVEELVEDVGGRVKDLVEEIRESPKNTGGGKIIMGILLIIWGGVELIKKMGWLEVDVWELVWRWWPAGIMLAGLSIIFGKRWWAGVIGFVIIGVAAYFILGNNLGFFR